MKSNLQAEKEKSRRSKLINQHFTRWRIIEFSHKNEKGGDYYLCECSCELKTRREVLVYHLLNGRSKSCGCIGSEKISGTKEYRAWKSMQQRCYSKNRKSYKYYGGRGIKVCKGWLDSFQNFLNDMGICQPNLTLDRIKTNLHYSCGKCEECLGNGWKFNCRWDTRKVQSRNRRNNILIKYKKETRCLSEWAEILNMNYDMLLQRFHLGWSNEDILSLSKIETKGENCHYAKLKEKDVLEIRKMYKKGKFGYVRISRIYGVTPQAIEHIINRKSWKHI